MTRGLSEASQKALMLSLVERIEKRFDTLEDRVYILTQHVAKLHIKSSIWGALAGLIPVVLGLAYFLMERNR